MKRSTVTLPVTLAPVGNANNFAVPDELEVNFKLPPDANVVASTKPTLPDTVIPVDNVLVLVEPDTPAVKLAKLIALPLTVCDELPDNTKLAPEPSTVPLLVKFFVTVKVLPEPIVCVAPVATEYPRQLNVPVAVPEYTVASLLAAVAELHALVALL